MKYLRELLKLIIRVRLKEKFFLTSLYNALESYLISLETLEVTADKSALILYAMVQSCFIAEFLKVSNRTHTASASSDAKEKA